MNTQPEALRLADFLDECSVYEDAAGAGWVIYTEESKEEPTELIAAELRRLYAENERLKAMVETA